MAESVRLMKKARKSMNVCPICWMPLYYYVPAEKGVKFEGLDKWRELQTIFKSKHSFSLQNDTTTERSRNKVVFGYCDLFFSTKDSMCVNDSHLFHKSQSSADEELEVNNIWNVFTGTSEDEKTEYGMDFDTGVEHNAKTTDFYRNVCVENGLFKSSNGVFATYEKVCESNKHASGDSEEKIKLTNVENVFKQMCDTFAGCVDCNKKMSTFRYVKKIFDVFFPLETILRRFTMTRLDVMTHYIILSGLIKKDEHKSHGNFFLLNVDRIENRKSWKFRVIIIWCYLQILCCLWEEDETSEHFRHHKNYIFTGTADLYMAFIFYLMFRSVDNITRLEFISFESFHYFYTSYVPFYLKKHNDDHVDIVNISRVVLQTNIDLFRSPFHYIDSEIKNALRKQMEVLQIAVCDFWVSKMKYIAHYIYQTEKIPVGISSNGQSFMGLYEFFLPAYKALEIINKSTGKEGYVAVTLSIKGYSDFLGPYWYWFHFRQITAVRIKQLCKEFKDKMESGSLSVARKTGLKLWNDWFVLFDNHVKVLTAQPILRNDVRVYMVLKSKMISNKL